MTSLNKIDFQTVTALALIVLALPALALGSWAMRATDRRRIAADGDYWAD